MAIKIKKHDRTFSYFVIALLLVAIPIGIYVVGQNQEIRQQAASATVLTFSPQSVTKRPGETFALLVMVDTGSNTISAAKILVDFDPTKLEAKSIAASDFLTVVLTSGKVTASNASITLGSSPTAPKKGAGKLAEITFKARGPTGATQITFDNATEVAGISEQTNVLSGKGIAQVTITTGGGQGTHPPTPTPTRANLTPPPVPSQAQREPGQRVGFGQLSQGSSQPPGQEGKTYTSPTTPLAFVTPVPQPAEEIKDPLIIAYLKMVLQFIQSLLGK